MTSGETIESERSFLELVGRQIIETVGEGTLPEAKQIRRDTPLPDYTPEQFAKLRSVMESAGCGALQDVTPGRVGMIPGYLAQLEGGLPNKVAAELAAILDADVPHGPIVVTVSSDVKTAPKGTDWMKSQKIPSAVTEINDAVLAISSLEGFEPMTPESVAFSYDPQTGEVAQDASRSQVYKFGYINDQPVYAMEVSRHYKPDGKYVQPNAGKLLQLSVDMVQRDSGSQVTHAAVVTAGLYAPSRRQGMVNTNEAGNNSFVSGLVTYGRTRMGEILGGDDPTPAPEDFQIVSEASRLIAMQGYAVREAETS